MKILELVFDLRSGGAERFAVDLSNELSKTNDVTIMALKDDTAEPELSLFYKYDLSDRVTYKNLGLHKGYTPRMGWRIYKAIKAEKADVVHLHGHGMPLYCYFAILLLNRKTKFYQTIHADIHNGYTSFVYRCLIKTVGNSHKMGFVALSETNYRDMMKAYPNIKSACITNGRAPIMPTDKFDEVKTEMASYKNNPNSLVYIHVARCNTVKNQTMLVEAFSKFIETGHDADLVVIGGGFDSELGESIKSKAGNRIHFIGMRKNVGDYLLNADVFCLSSNLEGMPITILEAILAGVPIVSTPVCGAVDVIINKKNGILSEGYSLNDYLVALEYSYSHLHELKETAVKMKDDSPYTIAKCAKKYMDFFNR